MNILAVLIAAIMGGFSAIYIKLVPQKQQVVIAVASRTPAQTPRVKTSFSRLADWQYPGSKVESSDSAHLILSTTDDFNKVSLWYQNKINSSGGKVKINSSINSAVNSRSENKTSITTNINASADTGGNTVTNGSVKNGNTNVQEAVSNSTGASQAETRINWSDGKETIEVDIAKSGGSVRIIITVSSK